MILAYFYQTRSTAQKPLKPDITNEPINILATTNLEQGKLAIKGLKKLGGYTDKFGQHWLVEQPGRTNGLPVILSANGNLIRYQAILISVDCLNGNDLNHVSEIQTQMEIMNIDETRKMGLQLCSLLKTDPEGFLAWCDKVGNHWLDSPLYGVSSRGTIAKKDISFQILHSFNNDKPWGINVMISDP